MPDIVSLEQRLLITAAQWLHLLVEISGIEPEVTRMEAVTVGPDGRKLQQTVSLAETLAQIDATTVVTVNYSDNDH